MRYKLRLLIIGLFVLAGASNVKLAGQALEPDDEILADLTSHQYDLSNEGRKFLLNESQKSDFFMFGELHGENEIPALLTALWPQMWKEGYRHIAAEVSPWAAYQLEFVQSGKGPEVLGLWTKQQAADAHAPAGPKTTVLWGCDMEEEQPQLLIRELAALNPKDVHLRQMVQLTKHEYTRQMAPSLLDLANRTHGGKDQLFNGISLRQNLVATLQIDTDRLVPDSKLIAQNRRELLMKEQFLGHFRGSKVPEQRSKVLLRFGRNHLHRGYDARGVSTLGNFVAEFAFARGEKVFNVGAFGAGGKASLMGETWDADERQDGLAFALLAKLAKYPAAVYDLRPVRQLLHSVPQDKRSPLQIKPDLLGGLL
jgi:hypothetical protein